MCVLLFGHNGFPNELNHETSFSVQVTSRLDVPRTPRNLAPPGGGGRSCYSLCYSLQYTAWAWLAKKIYIMQLTVDDVFLAYHRRLSNRNSRENFP